VTESRQLSFFVPRNVPSGHDPYSRSLGSAHNRGQYLFCCVKKVKNILQSPLLGVPLRWLGHEHIEMTAKYLATVPDKQQQRDINTPLWQ
jgi:hypothetical protein